MQKTAESPIIVLPGNRLRHEFSPAIIGIGAVPFGTDPSHTTWHAGPHQAVREVEVALWLLRREAGDWLPRCATIEQGFTLPLSSRPGRGRASEAVPLTSSQSKHSFSFGPSPKATTASADSSTTACAGALSGSTPRSPQVRTHSFTARSPNLRHHPLVTRASRFLARSPWTAPPCIRFLSIDPQLRSTLPPHGRSPFRSCASLRSP